MVGKYVKDKKIILFLLTALLILSKSVLWLISIPALQTPDSDRHFSTIMWYAEKNDNTIERHKKPFSQNMYDVTTYHIPNEYMEFLNDIDFEQTRFNINSHQTLLNSTTVGKNEQKILNYNLDKNFHFSRPTVVSYPPLYYKINSYIYKLFFNTNILSRLYAIRLFSVLVGLLIAFVAYKSARLLEFNSTQSIIFTIIIAFQPMLSMLSIAINLDILLILAFSLFTYFSIRILKSPLKFNKKNILSFIFSITGLVLSVLMGIYTKPPAKILILYSAVLATFYIFRYLSPIIHKIPHNIKQTILRILAIFGFIFLLIPVLMRLTPLGDLLNKHIAFLGNQEITIDDKILQFIKAETQITNTYLIISSYWGNFGWTDTPMHFSIYIIIMAIVITLLSVFIYALFKNTFKFKLIYVYLLILWFGFCLALIHFDFQYYLAKNNVYGLQGRYFMPIILPSFLVLAKSINFIIKRYTFTTKLAFIGYLMILLNMIALFYYIIPRYYL